MNSWRVAAARKASKRIKEMRAAGELADNKGGDRKSRSAPRTVILKDLIGNRATQRASAWDRLAKAPPSRREPARYGRGEDGEYAPGGANGPSLN
jgi:hypothetical protein